MIAKAGTLSEHRRDLFRELILRDIRLRYRRSVLGLLWSQLNPLAQIVIFSVVFTRVVDLNIPNYPVFVFVGVITWQWFESSMVAATGSVVAGRDLVRRPGFPTPLLPSLAIATTLVEYLLALPILLIVIAVTSGGVPGTVVALPAVLLVQFLICLGPAYLLSTLQVWLRDTAQALNIGLRVLFFATPVIYESARLTGSGLGVLHTLPMARLISAQRDVLINGRWPPARPLIGLGVAGVAVALVGLYVFRSAQYRFAEEV